jgi:hypothetical protein
MPFIVYPPPSEPLPPPPPDEGSQLWEVLYESLGFHRDTDEATGFQLAALCQVLMTPLQRVYDLVREREGRAAGGTMLDPDNVPAEGLLYLSQYVGAKLLPVMSEQQRREEIKRPTTWRRGEDETIELVVKRELTGSAWIRIKPRTPGPGQIYIRVLAEQCASPERLEQTLLDEAIPAWVVMDFEAIVGVKYDDMDAGFAGKTYGEVDATFAGKTSGDIDRILPEELPE